jgi:hypothetical protein
LKHFQVDSLASCCEAVLHTLNFVHLLLFVLF